ncbi:MAG: hypothetical protein WCS87_14070 [Methylococcaceae bacterium]
MSYIPPYLRRTNRQAILLEAEFALLLQNRSVDEAKREGIQEHFATYKMGLVKFLNECIDEFASEQVSRVPAIELTQRSKSEYREISSMPFVRFNGKMSGTKSMCLTYLASGSQAPAWEPEAEAPASRHWKLELPNLHSQAGAWE